MNAIATGTGLNSAALIGLPNASPSSAAGRNATSRLTTNPRERASLARPRATRDEARAVFPDDREHRAGLNHDLEYLALLIVEVEQIGGEDQVPGR